MTLDNASSGAVSLVYGSTEEPLWKFSLGDLIETQAARYGERTALVFPWQNIRRTYRDLLVCSRLISKALIESGLKRGDCVGIFAGNCCEYIEVFLGAGAIGCPVAVLNSNYTPTELYNAITFSGCRVLCAARCPGPKRDVKSHLDRIVQDARGIQVVLFDDTEYTKQGRGATTSFDTFLARGRASQLSDSELRLKQSSVHPSDTLNLQFTSGTTGVPKAAMLSHVSLINNGRFMGDRFGLIQDDVVCCPPPLFHCFGLVMGFLSSYTHGSSVVYPSQTFEADAVLDAVEAERCTAILGVPTMFVAELEATAKRPRKLDSLKKALAAGSLVLPAVVGRMEQEMNVREVIIAYGMTETSPVTFSTSLTDSVDRRLNTVGTVFPHTGAKIVDLNGELVPFGVAGEICTSGYALQKGYLSNPTKTREVMRTDADGVLWIHTGDEGFIDSEGYCRITGRIKDMIIRGGENIVPGEVEERLLSHDSIAEVSVVGVPHPKYGEQVAAFVRQAGQALRPSNIEVAMWVRETLGRHKAPEHIFWIGDENIGADFPKTASGKHQKHLLRDLAARLLKPVAPQAKL